MRAARNEANSVKASKKQIQIYDKLTISAHSYSKSYINESREQVLSITQTKNLK